MDELAVLLDAEPAVLKDRREEPDFGCHLQTFRLGLGLTETFFMVCLLGHDGFFTMSPSSLRMNMLVAVALLHLGSLYSASDR